MRTLISLLTVAAWLTAPAALGAQSTGGQPSPTPPPQAAEPQPGTGANRIDFGARIGTVSGDPARWQRYRDLRDGPVINRFDFEYERNNWLWSVGGDHVGYRDQRYQVNAERPGRASLRFLWDSIPLFISQDTLTLYREESPGVLRIDDAIQTGVQNGTITLRDAARNAFGVTTRTQRHYAVGEFRFQASPTTDVYMNVAHTSRTGNIPFGATFGFNNAIEVPLPIDQRTTNVNTGLEWANPQAMLRVNWDGSFHDNRIEALVWDNPLRITDTATAPAQGRMAQWPSNTYQTISTAGSIKLPARSRLVGSVALGWARQNDALVPHTINSALPSPALPRATAEARGQTASTYVSFTSRPVPRIMIAARHRLYQFDNETPAFERNGGVSYDTTLRTGLEGPHFYSVTRQVFDVDVTTNVGIGAWKVGYGWQGGERTARHFETTTEHAFRTSYDIVGSAPYSVRALYEHTMRDGDGFDTHILEEAGEQVTMRHFDIAARDRDRVSFIVTAAPHDTFDLIGSVAVGQDDYTHEGIGLRDNAHRIYTAGVNFMPRETFSTGISYSFEQYDAFLNNRQATTLAQAFEPTLRWDMDTDDRAHNILAQLELPQAFARTDLRLTYDFSDSRTTFVYSLPAGSTLTQPEQLPAVKHTEHQLELGGVRPITTHWALGVDYWFHKYDVEDFALGGDINQGIAFPILEPGQQGAVNTVLLNYLYRPFRGHTGILRAIYSF
jgi:MtrB/PioB family decaheme-associated outer membrane protein